jgi:hypothetical protein
MSVDPFQELFRKLRIYSLSSDDDKAKPYLVLIQHSLSFQLRQQASSAADETVYRRAGLRTPPENAQRDLEGGQLWMKHVTQQMSRETDVLWVRTNTRRLPSWVQEVSNLQVIDAAKDPFGWNEDADNTVNLEDLNTIVRAVESHLETHQPCRSGLVIETLSPILQRHGINQTVRLIKTLKRLVSPIVISVLSESLNLTQHMTLKDLAEAVLSIEGGDATLLRKGVRERDNVVRESLQFKIAANRQGQRCIHLLDASDEKPQPDDVPADDKPTAENNEGIGASRRHNYKQTKIQLHMEEDGDGKASQVAAPPVPQSGTPQIFMDDDDPEYDDYDEDDPDDDLDI